MSAYVVSKLHIDLLVRAGLSYGGGSDPFRWWAVGEDGAFCAENGAHGFHELHELAESYGPEEQARRGLLSPSQFGQILISENVRSVSFRYSSPGRTVYYGAETAAGMDDLDADAGELPGPIDAFYMAPYVYENPGYTLTPGELFKACACLNYQSCEHDGWRASEAYTILGALTDYAQHKLWDGPWGWDPEDLAGRALEFSRRIV